MVGWGWWGGVGCWGRAKETWACRKRARRGGARMECSGVDKGKQGGAARTRRSLARERARASERVALNSFKYLGGLSKFKGTGLLSPDILLQHGGRDVAPLITDYTVRSPMGRTLSMTHVRQIDRDRAGPPCSVDCAAAEGRTSRAAQNESARQSFRVPQNLNGKSRPVRRVALDPSPSGESGPRTLLRTRSPPNPLCLRSWNSAVSEIPIDDPARRLPKFLTTILSAQAARLDL